MCNFTQLAHPDRGDKIEFNRSFWGGWHFSCINCSANNGETWKSTSVSDSENMDWMTMELYNEVLEHLNLHPGEYHPCIEEYLSIALDYSCQFRFSKKRGYI